MRVWAGDPNSRQGPKRLRPEWFHHNGCREVFLTQPPRQSGCVTQDTARECEAQPPRRPVLAPGLQRAPWASVEKPHPPLAVATPCGKRTVAAFSSLGTRSLCWCLRPGLRFGGGGGKRMMRLPVRRGAGGIKGVLWGGEKRYNHI